MSRRPFTLILPYYENPGMLEVQIAKLFELPAEVRESLHLIVIDDGSPVAPLKPIYLATTQLQTRLASFQAFRIEVDVRWNWIAARNIGVENAKTDWVLLTDIDHTIPEATARRIQEQKLDARSAYRFSRVDAPDMAPYKPHPNTWLLTRELMDKIGGYDERFSGFYGSDGEFRDRVKDASRSIIILDEAMVRWPREVQADASTTRYGRKEQQDHDGVKAARARIAKEGGRPLRLSFPFHRVL